MARRLPDFRIPIDDRHAADFWFTEWVARFSQTKDHAFKEAYEEMQRYIDEHFDDEGGDS